MPKDLPNKPCRADTKKQSVVAKGCKNSLVKVSKVLSSKIAKKKNEPKKRFKKIVQNDDVEKPKVKDKKKINVVVPIKTRSGACLQDSNAVGGKTNASKMKDKLKPTVEKPTKPKDEKGKTKKELMKKASSVVNNAAHTTATTTTTTLSTATKKEPKKVKNEKDEEPVVKKVSKSSAKKDVDSTDKKETLLKATDKVDDTENHIISSSATKKDAKKDKESAKKTLKAKKDDSEKKDAVKQDKNDDKNTTKKDTDETIKKEPVTKKDSKSKEDTTKINEKETKTATKSEPAKKRTAKKSAKDAHVIETATKKDTDDKIMPSNEPIDKKEPLATQSNKIKFFKSKSKKAEKSKEPVSKKNNDLKDAFSVYDNIDEDSEGINHKTISKKKESPATTKAKVSKFGKETELKMKQHLEQFKKTKLKAKDASSNKDDKRKLESDSEVDTKIRKKAKKNVVDDNDNEKDSSSAAPPPPPSSSSSSLASHTTTTTTTTATATKTKSKSNKKVAKPKEEDLSSPSSDSTPLNRLVSKISSSAKKDSKSSKPAASSFGVKREPNSDDSEIEIKKKAKTETPTKKPPKKSQPQTKSTSSKKSTTADKKVVKTPKKSTPKKTVRFEKQATAKPAPKIVRKRKQRMASLNAMAMVHCLYDNDSKSASVSSYDSTEYSDNNAAIEPVETKRKSEPSPVPEIVKVENKETAVVKYEKDQVLAEDQADPVINRESLRTAPGLRSIGKHWDMNSSSISSTLSDENLEMIASPIVIKEITSSLDKPKNVLKKKFARALRRQISEESSEEEKHQALLLEEKKRMVRRRRRQRKEITMDLKDMVVCKRMASLNATAILAASYSSLTGKRTITVKSSGKSEEKRENVEKKKKTTESVIAKIKSRKLPFIRKKFSSSSDADVEDEADLSGGEVVVKSASSSGKQQVSLIVNQDSGVTITGVYLNSTTKSTHHQGFCSISGMQYRISSTSHTQTEATTVTTEPIVRNTQEPLRPPITVSLHPERQSPPPHVALNTANHPSPVKTYTPLGALSNMQPPGSPHHAHHLHHHPKTVTISSTQEISALERHGCPSAFSAPAVYGPPPPQPPPLPNVPTRPPYPMLPKTPPEPGFVTGYYQPAGPLISHHHHHHHHHHHVQQTNTSTTSTAALPASTATSTSSSASTISFAKVSQSPLVQPPTPPASNVTQPVSENSDNEITSATTPAAEITSSAAEVAQEEPNFPPSYRFGSSANPPFRSPSHNYQTYYPSPPSTASLSHPQQQAHFQEILYSSQPPAGPPGPYHLSYLQPKGAPYHGPPPSFQRRYIPALPPQQYFHHEYSSSAPVSNAAVQQQVVVPAHPLTSTAESYHSAPPTPSVVESYPPPPPPLYYSGYGSAPPSPYYPYAASSRSLTLVETSCPCPLQTCQKNGHTGPLTGIISKGPVKQHSTPLSPVALSLPKEPQDIRSLPSPARGSAGCRPTPSPAIATAKNPSCWSESTDCSYDTTGLLAISKTTSGNVRDAESDNSLIKNGLKTSSRTELKKLKIKKFKSRKSTSASVNGSAKHHNICKQDENMKSIVDGFRINGRPPFYTDVSENCDTVGLIAAASVTDYVSRVKPTIMEVCESDYCDENLVEIDEPKVSKKYHSRKRRSIDDDAADKDMLKSYPVMRENVQKIAHPPEDAQITIKKPKLEGDLDKVIDVEQKTVDVEKNNYLSALQLCSVANNDDNNVVVVVDDAEKIQEKNTNADLFFKSISENVAPLRKREEEKSLKIQSKTTTDTVDQTSQHENTSVEELIVDVPETKSTSNTVRCKAHVEPKKPPRLRRKRWTTKKKNKKKSNKSTKSSEEEKIEAENAEKIRRAELLSLTQKRASCKLKWSNGWTWLGEPFVSKVFLNTEGSEVLRTCYHAMKHQSGDIIKPKDCILLKSGSKKSDLPYVAKVAHLWEDPEDGEMMMSLFWFYRPEHTEHDSIHSESPYELYASKHKDINSVACIEDKCYVLTFNEYCRYHKSIRQSEESVDVSSVIVPPLSKKRYPRHSLLPPENTSLDLVFFCRKIYDFRQHRLLKNPFFV